jgi:hypothetical protein
VRIISPEWLRERAVKCAENILHYNQKTNS